MIVAHPDDESLFGAGMMMRFKKAWTVICCTVPFHDPVRADKFHNACNILGAFESIVLDHQERAGLIPVPDLSKYDLIVTHGAAGEYGNVQHRELHGAIKNKWPEMAVYFGFGSKRADITLALSDSEAARKLEAIQAYDHRCPRDRGKMKWENLLETFDGRFDLWREPYTFE